MKKILLIGLSSACAVAAVSCTQYQQQGAMVGALGGAAIGAVSGDDSRDVIRGAAIGAAAGTGVAAYQENKQQNNSYRSSSPQGTTSEEASYPEPEYDPQDPPVAESTRNPNEVISPHAPYNVVNVEGFKSGQTVRDPYTQKTFRVP